MVGGAEAKRRGMARGIGERPDGGPRWPFAHYTWCEDLECVDGTVLRRADVKLLIAYHYNQRHRPPRGWYAEQGLSLGFLRQFGPEMLSRVPAGFDPRGSLWDFRRWPDPDCPYCRGAGGRAYPIPGTKATDFAQCRCIQGPPQPDPSCPRCRGNGGREAQSRMPDGSVRFSWGPCGCLR